jgi:hypothetical protein
MPLPPSAICTFNTRKAVLSLERGQAVLLNHILDTLGLCSTPRCIPVLQKNTQKQGHNAGLRPVLNVGLTVAVQ